MATPESETTTSLQILNQKPKSETPKNPSKQTGNANEEPNEL